MRSISRFAFLPVTEKNMWYCGLESGTDIRSRTVAVEPKAARDVWATSGRQGSVESHLPACAFTLVAWGICSAQEERTRATSMFLFVAECRGIRSDTFSHSPSRAHHGE